jgi:hypothetical protein
MERSKIFKVPIGLEKTILHMLDTGEVDITMLSQEDKAWLGRMGAKSGLFSLEKPLLLKQKKRMKQVKSTNPAYVVLEVLSPPDK